MVWSEAIRVMLVRHAKWRTFTQRPFPPPGSCGMMLSLSLESRSAVDAMNEAAAAQGGQDDVNPMEDHGFMYTRDLADPDGHMWAAPGIDPAAMSPAAGRSRLRLEGGCQARQGELRGGRGRKRAVEALRRRCPLHPLARHSGNAARVRGFEWQRRCKTSGPTQTDPAGSLRPRRAMPGPAMTRPAICRQEPAGAHGLARGVEPTSVTSQGLCTLPLLSRGSRWRHHSMTSACRPSCRP